MIKTSIEKIAKDIGYDIGNSDDVVQSDLLNGFCEALANSMQDRQLEMQLCYIAGKLKPKTEKVLEGLVEFIKLKNQE